MKFMIEWLLGRFKKRDDGPSSPYVEIGALLIAAGLALMSPSFKDALLSYINKRQDLGLSLDAPWWVGVPVLATGVLFLIFAFFQEVSGSHKGQFVAIRHQSFQPLSGTLPKEALPRRMQKRKVLQYTCDQSNFMSGGTIDPLGAVRQQERLAQHISGVRLSDPDAAFGYYGIVHIPLQFLAGCSISTYPEVALFELNRNDNRWYELQQGVGLDIGVTRSKTIDPATPIAAVIRIEVSYPIAVQEPAKIVSGPYREYVLRINKPGIDKVTHYDQVNEIAESFREILDEIHNELDSSLHVHVFYSGPVSVGFSLGRRISRSIHNRVFVYNYTSQSDPAYAWGVDVSRDTPPQDMVVLTNRVA